MTSYDNPGGRGDRQSLIDISTSSGFLTGTAADIIDGDTATGCALTPGNTNPWITFDFRGPVTIDAARIWWRSVVHHATIGAFQWKGSNDNSSWTNIGGLFLLGTPEEFEVYPVDVGGTLAGNVTAYRYYKMEGIKAVTPPSAPEIREFEFQIEGELASGDSDSEPTPPPPPTPDYGEPGGTGDRRSLIWVSQNVREKDGNAENLIQGNTSTDDEANSFRFFGGTEGGFVFDFRPSGYKQRIVGFKWYQSAVEALGLWDFQYADAAAGPWTTVATAIALGAGSTTEEFLFTNPNAYNFYRLVKSDTDGSGAVELDDTVWVREIEFKIAHGDTVAEPLPAYITGDRTGDINVTFADLSTTGTAPDTSFFNGNTSEDVTKFTVSSDGVMTFEFFAPQAINEMRWYLSSDAPQGWWRAFGSNNGTTWTLLGREQQFRGGSFVFNAFSANQRPYKYYQFRQTAGTTTTTPFVREVEFRSLLSSTDPLYCFAYTNDGGSGDRTDSGDGTVEVTLTAGVLESGALDNLIDGLYLSNGFPTATVSGSWELVFDFGAPKLVKQAAHVFTTGSYGSGTTVVMEGSNDGSTWTQIGAQIDISDSNETINYSEGSPAYFYTLLRMLDANDLAFRYYKLRRTGGSGNATFQEFEFYIDGNGTGPARTSYLNNMGRGDRRAQIDITTSATVTTGVITNLIDGTGTGLAMSGTTGTILKFDFGERVAIDETFFSGFIPGADFHGTYAFEGSNDDFGVDINTVQATWHGGTGFTGVGCTQKTDTVGLYRWYRLRCLTGGWDNSQGIGEFEFRIAPTYSTGACFGDEDSESFFSEESESDSASASESDSASASESDSASASESESASASESESASASESESVSASESESEPPFASKYPPVQVNAVIIVG